MFAYFAETGMHDSAPDTVVAGYLFSKEGAASFRQTYESKIMPLIPPDKHGRRIFHASKLIGRFDHYHNLTEPEANRIVDLMVDAIIASAMLGCVIGMEKTEYAKAVRHSPILRQLSGSEYTVCLFRCIENIAAWATEKKLDGKIEYVFEAGCEHQNEANVLLGRISHSEKLKLQYRWELFGFAEKSPNVSQLFAPDLLAWEWQRARLNSLNPKRAEKRASLTKLLTRLHTLKNMKPNCQSEFVHYRTHSTG